MGNLIGHCSSPEDGSAIRSSAKSLRVLQVVSALGMGGAETWLMEVLRLWSKNRTGLMDFLVTSGCRGVFDDEAQRLGARMYYVRYGRANLAAFAWQFRHLLRESRYDAIHDHQDYASGWHFLIGASALPPIRVTHVHNPSYQIRNNYGVTLSRRFAARIGKALVARYSTHIVATSKQALEEYGFDAPGFNRIPKAALYCGFDPKRFFGDSHKAKLLVCNEFGWPLDAKIILFVGRIDRSVDFSHPQNHKNSGFAVSVGIECARRDRKIHMLLAGTLSAAVPVLEDRVAAAGLRKRVRFAGIRTDIEKLMLASQVLLFPSRGEGLGMAAVEAQAAGLPVLASMAVPRECVVVPDLVRFKELERGEAEWAEDVLQITTQPRNGAHANQLVAVSPFAIENSAGALSRLYSQGTLC
jgi:glycosyltransferase involved in cell wall biosynthesis